MAPPQMLYKEKMGASSVWASENECDASVYKDEDYSFSVVLVIDDNTGVFIQGEKKLQEFLKHCPGSIHSL